MANYRFARFITEVAPLKFVSVMRYRATQMLDTINEEERECSANDSLALAPKSTLSSLSSDASSSNATNSKYLLKEIQITLCAFGKTPGASGGARTDISDLKGILLPRKVHGYSVKDFSTDYEEELAWLYYTMAVSFNFYINVASVLWLMAS
ncbi:hypothetical protein RJ640_004133 [Escallonia rubra]|uniref:Uncharacterized protein n=1 Tax=Escallonia rubra TaxID=112253 RepID=A0AA88ULS2_9ASTE|nr:hypothetical protein RJ640_004133 [Escallonia rubra]